MRCRIARTPPVVGGAVQRRGPARGPGPAPAGRAPGRHGLRPYVPEAGAGQTRPRSRRRTAQKPAESRAAGSLVTSRRSVATRPPKRARGARSRTAGESRAGPRRVARACRPGLLRHAADTARHAAETVFVLARESARVQHVAGTRERPGKRHCGRGSVGRASPCQGEGREFESRRPLGSGGSSRPLRPGGVAERRGNGLQSRLHGFKSRLHLQGRLAQRESASLTRKRSLVQSQYRPLVRKGPIRRTPRD